MKLIHIDNACCIYESKGFKLLADPWLTDGAFEGSWFHYPPLHTDFSYVKNVDALYISHLHPDHYDETVLKEFIIHNPEIPVICLDKHPNFLKRKLDKLGFKNVYHIKDQETITIGPMEITIYAPFVNHPFDDSLLGNFIDSGIVIKAEGKVILNANDNTPTAETARMLKEKHGKFDLVQLKDSLAGPYPACFTNPTHQKKLSEITRLIKRQLTAMCKVAKILETEWFQPFASDYQLGGKLADKNQYLGIAGKRFSANFISSKGLKPLVLNEQGSIDLVTGDLKATYRTNLLSYEQWLEKVKKIPYDYELQDNPGNILDFTYELIEARSRLRQFQTKFNYWPDITVAVNNFHFSMNKTNIPTKKYIKFTMDPKALAGLLTGRYHWNNLEVGCHIEIDRQPNIYDPDLVNAMCFFHV